MQSMTLYGYAVSRRGFANTRQIVTEVMVVVVVVVVVVLHSGFTVDVCLIGGENPKARQDDGRKRELRLLGSEMERQR